jgi:hypothetical protein
MAAKKSKSIRKSAPARPAKARTANPTHRRTVVPAPITPDDARAQLRELAMNLWWSWNEVAQRPFAAIDPVLWHATKRSPLAVLAQASPAALSAVGRTWRFWPLGSRCWRCFRSRLRDLIFR